MAITRKTVNLDAMIQRADFSIVTNEPQTVQQIPTISLRDLQKDSFLLPNLRKPDFQRETNHWTPEQVASLIECFINNELIPSIILWNSQSYIFIIDGCHRLSALRAWVENDYGDGPISKSFFNYQIEKFQQRAADETRRLIEKRVGLWQHWQTKNQQPNLPPDERRLASGLSTRAFQLQWVSGDADKAEASFFKINTQGTPLDDIEELLISNRKKPCAIAARSIIRAGTGYKYWSFFSDENQKSIEKISKEIYQILFEPELNSPIKTLDLPLGGVAGVRTALSLLIDFLLVANRDQNGYPKNIKDQLDDSSGDESIRVLNNSLRLVKRMTGNDKGSLGLHPAVYFYSPSGKHSVPLFMGMAMLIAKKLVNNDSDFFKKFTKIRKIFEEDLLDHKQLLTAIIQQIRSNQRYEIISKLFDFMITKRLNDKNIRVSDKEIAELCGVKGKFFVGEEKITGKQFSSETKSAVYLKEALDNALRCPVCEGYLDPRKSISYDHSKPRRDGGLGNEENLQLTHPYCNQSVKQ